MDIKRWEPENTFLGYNMKPTEDGSFVLFENYQRDVAWLQAEVERLREQSNARLFTLANVQSDLTQARELLVEIKDYDISHGAQQAIETYLARQSSSSAKDLTNQSLNQCDGCQAGIPVEVNQYGTPLHRMGSEGGYPDYMACTAKLYAED